MPDDMQPTHGTCATARSVASRAALVLSKQTVPPASLAQ